MATKRKSATQIEKG
jgi:hypothetical protein